MSLISTRDAARLVLVGTLGSALAASAAPGSWAQTAEPAFVPMAKVTVANNSSQPKAVAGTNVAPFILGPHQQAELDMSIPPPSGPAGATIRYPNPVRFDFSVGTPSAAYCKGNIDMSLRTEVYAATENKVTNCVAHSLGTNGANCQIAISAKGFACEGGLAFTAQ